MPIRKLCWLCGCATFAVAAILSALVIALKHEPTFYRLVPDTVAKTHEAMKAALVVGPVQMLEAIRGRQETWGCQMSEPHINCFLEKDFNGLPEAASLRRLGISSPRVALQDNEIRLAFRYGEGWFSTVVSYHLRIWLVPKEENMIAVQVLSARAGALPISSQAVLQQLTDYAGKYNWKVTLYRHEGTPIATVSLPPLLENHYYLLTKFRFSANELAIEGRTSENVATGPLPLLPAAVDVSQ